MVPELVEGNKKVTSPFHAALFVDEEAACRESFAMYPSTSSGTIKYALILFKIYQRHLRASIKIALQPLQPLPYAFLPLLPLLPLPHSHEYKIYPIFVSSITSTTLTTLK